MKGHETPNKKIVSNLLTMNLIRCHRGATHRSDVNRDITDNGKGKVFVRHPKEVTSVTQPVPVMSSKGTVETKEPGRKPILTNLHKGKEKGKPECLEIRTVQTHTLTKFIYIMDTNVNIDVIFLLFDILVGSQWRYRQYFTGCK